MNILYTLRANKPDSYDYCRGCLMESYGSDNVLIEALSEVELIKEISKLKAYELGINEEGYEIHYEIYHPNEISYDERNRIDGKVNDRVEIIKEKRKLAHHKELAELKVKQEERQRQQAIKEFKNAGLTAEDLK